ncbi:MAG: hypothetical protein WDW38_011548 [Sanguina aurantia]
MQAAGSRASAAGLHLSTLQHDQLNNPARSTHMSAAGAELHAAALETSWCSDPHVFWTAVLESLLQTDPAAAVLLMSVTERSMLLLAAFLQALDSHSLQPSSRSPVVVTNTPQDLAITATPRSQGSSLQTQTQHDAEEARPVEHLDFATSSTALRIHLTRVLPHHVHSHAIHNLPAWFPKSAQASPAGSPTRSSGSSSSGSSASSSGSSSSRVRGDCIPSSESAATGLVRSASVQSIVSSLAKCHTVSSSTTRPDSMPTTSSDVDTQGDVEGPHTPTAVASGDLEVARVSDDSLRHQYERGDGMGGHAHSLQAVRQRSSGGDSSGSGSSSNDRHSSGRSRPAHLGDEDGQVLHGPSVSVALALSLTLPPNATFTLLRHLVRMLQHALALGGASRHNLAALSAFLATEPILTLMDSLACLPPRARQQQLPPSPIHATAPHLASPPPHIPPSPHCATAGHLASPLPLPFWLFSSASRQGPSTNQTPGRGHPSCPVACMDRAPVPP